VDATNATAAKPQILWIGGWSSSLEVWRGPLESLYPSWRHGFVAVETVQDLEPGDLAERVRDLCPEPTRCVVVAWSLGSQLALRTWNAGLWPEGLGLLAVCPVVEFCAAEGPWRRIHLERMIRGLGRDREGVLEEFRKLLREECPEDEARAWREAAAGIPPEALVRGLELLRDGRLEWIRPGPGLVLVEGAGDRVSPRLEAVMEAGELAGLRRFVLATGHVPFLEDAEGFGRILEEGR